MSKVRVDGKCLLCDAPTASCRGKTNRKYLVYCSTECRLKDMPRVRSECAKRAPLASEEFSDSIPDKRCCTCKKRKSVVDFYKNKANKDGLDVRCIPCKKKQSAEYRKRNAELLRRRAAEYRVQNLDKIKAREREDYLADKAGKALRRKDATLKRQYGISLTDFENIALEQNYCCAICKKDPKETDPLRGRLVVDHCHATGKVRGLLCPSCNLALGHFFDSVVIVRSVLEYLEKHNNNAA